MIRALLDNFNIPVTCKVRCLRTEEATIELCKKLELAGASIITVHGRLKEHNKDLMGPANWDIIKKVKEALSIPVFANGGIRTMEDVKECLSYTGADGVMTSESILEYPALFDPVWYHLEDLMIEYLDLAEHYKEDHPIARNHLYKSLFTGFKDHIDLRDSLFKCEDFEQMREITRELKERRKGQEPQSKIGWYHRYWKNHETETPYTTQDFNEFIQDFQVKEDAIVNRKQFESKELEISPAVSSLFTANSDEEYE